LEEKKIYKKIFNKKIKIKRMRIKLEIKTNKRTFYIFESLFESRDEIEKKIQFHKRIINKKTTIKILRAYFLKKRIICKFLIEE
jgi:hypothetical protein